MNETDIKNELIKVVNPNYDSYSHPPYLGTIELIVFNQKIIANALLYIVEKLNENPTNK
jgi:hypothetical protein